MGIAKYKPQDGSDKAMTGLSLLSEAFSPSEFPFTPLPKAS
jgi:hypothetical protein